jgi:Ca2+:H+ antiporter
MDLAFRHGLVLIVVLAAMITGQLASDGWSDWLKGAQLLTVYLLLALAFFWLPSGSPGHA